MNLTIFLRWMNTHGREAAITAAYQVGVPRAQVDLWLACHAR